jgi:uncharacterized phage protein (TIGR02218 family)
MTAFLASEATRFALCWRLERRDGVAIGFTSHDRDLWRNGFRFQAGPGVSASAIEDRRVEDGEALDIAGALSGASLREADLRAGHWDGAEVRLFAIDCEDPSQALQITRGMLGSVRLERGSFTAEIEGPGAVLDRAIVEETSPECRAELGDPRCRVDLAPLRTIARVVHASGAAVTIDRSEAASNAWAWGRVRWLDGANGGLSQRVLNSAGNVLTFASPPAFAPVEGDRIELVEGCDKRFSTCRDRFANAANFRGEPHLPGVDLLTRYPGE